ncbi:hypothetical protein ANAEL_02814 [Anaerolineales bacterium]|nr:hypothetical protein ANAEL_02814 [Anaerolineales bacterium]
MGLPTRGKTASNRLRRVDNFILLYEPSLLTRTEGRFRDAFFVDLGYGFDARTTLESAARFRRVNPTLSILGVEIDKERVESAMPYADAITHFRVGGFNLPLLPGESVRLIRAFNVLRQYEEKDFAPAYETLARHVLPGGLMIEGTSNPFGSLWVANLARKILESDSSPALRVLSNSQKQASGVRSWKMEALVFSTNFRMGFDITDFQAVLPKNYIHHVLQGELIHDFLEAWKRSAAETSSAKTFGVRQWFAASAESLAAKGYKIDIHKKWLTKGWLIWNK